MCQRFSVLFAAVYSNHEQIGEFFFALSQCVWIIVWSSDSIGHNGIRVSICIFKPVSVYVSHRIVTAFAIA
jgi:hypothetical protein